ncbi:MAG TPA: PH domain-containing protein [Mycobacteriales bacterium]|nr:PH domain-containing protein [Mycobacteriales bacterium]
MTTKFRHSVAVPVAGIIAFVGALAVGTASWWFSPVLLVPLAVILWGWLSGVDVDDRGVVVRSAVARRRLPWSDIEGFSARDRRVVAHLRRGGVVPLPSVRPADLPRLIAAGGQQLGEGQ